jgi:hypothetical protein
VILDDKTDSFQVARRLNSQQEYKIFEDQTIIEENKAKPIELQND